MAEAARQMEETMTNGPDEEAVLAVNLSKVRKAIGSVKLSQEFLSEIATHAKDKGVNIKAAKRAFAIIESGDAETWLKETQATTQYLRILRHGIQESQLQLSFESHLAPIDEKAALDGRAAGLADESAQDCPHDASTLAGQAWLKAYGQGLSERKLILSMVDDEPEGTRDGDED